MWRSLLTVAIFLALTESPHSSLQASGLDGLTKHVSQDRLRQHILELSTRPAETNGGPRQDRYRYTLEERRFARDYLVNALSSYGYDVHLEPLTEVLGQSEEGDNVVARRPGTVSDRVLVLGAHYDTVSGSPGADDNASGVAGLLEIARVLADHQLDVTIEFVLFDLEERPFIGFGSRNYVERARDEGKQIVGAVIFDMIGFTADRQEQIVDTFTPERFVSHAENVDLNEGTFVAVIANSGSRPVNATVAPWQWVSGDAQQIRSTHLASSFIAATRQLGNRTTAGGPEPRLPAATLVVQGTGDATPVSQRSDHIHFWVHQIPAVHITDTSFLRDGDGRYHTADDEISTIDFDFLKRVVDATLRTVLDFTDVVQYTIGDSEPLLNADFYTGETTGTGPLQVATAWPYEQGVLPSSDSPVPVVFESTRTGTNDRAFFLVHAYDPDSVIRLTQFEPRPDTFSFPVAWQPDGLAIVSGDQTLSLNLNSGSSGRSPGFTVTRPSAFNAYRPHTFTMSGLGSFTRHASPNWYVDIVGQGEGYTGHIGAMPWVAAGQPNPHKPVMVTHFPLDTQGEFGRTDVSSDGSKLTFAYRTTAENRAIHVIQDLTSILEASPVETTLFSSEAPVSMTDSAITTVRESQEIQDGPVFLWGASHVSYVEAQSDTGHDVFVSDVSGQWRRPPRRITLPGDQGTAIPFLGGSRVLCSNVSSSSPGIAIASLRATAPVWDSGRVTIDDGNGSSLHIDEETSIEFPSGVNHQIYMETPIRRAAQDRFPLTVTATDATRTIGPYGTQFSRPVTVRMRYTDAELRGQSDESPMIFAYERDTNRYSRQVPVEDITHDPATNTVVFNVSYASTFVLAFTRVGDDKALKSYGSTERVEVTWKNTTDVPLSFRWIGLDGKQAGDTGTIAAGAEYHDSTFAGHVFLFQTTEARADNVKQFWYMIPSGKAQQTVELREDAVAGVSDANTFVYDNDFYSGSYQQSSDGIGTGSVWYKLWTRKGNGRQGQSHYTEIARTKDYIELQDPRNRTKIRLTARIAEEHRPDGKVNFVDGRLRFLDIDH